MNSKPALTWGIGLVGAVAVGAAIWFFTRQEKGTDFAEKFEGVVDNARGKAGEIARMLRDKATPVMQTVGDLVEKNAEVVSALANINADQVRKTGQEIKQAATTLEKNLGPLTDL